MYKRGYCWDGYCVNGQRDRAAAEVSASRLSYKMEHGPQPVWGQSCPVFQKKQEQQWLREGNRALRWGWGAFLLKSFTQYLNLEFTI